MSRSRRLPPHFARRSGWEDRVKARLRRLLVSEVRRRLAAGVVLAFGLGVWSPSTRGDRIVLRGGGQLRGKVLADPKHLDRVQVLTERGKKPLSFEKARITEVVAEPSPLDDYLARRDVTPKTARAQYELGLWCERQKLHDLADIHYQAALASDKDHAESNKKLGFVKLGGQWLKGDELREAQGLVRDHGQWITSEEKTQREKDRAISAEQTVWSRRLRLLREAIASGADDRRREAESQLMEIRDPAAVGPLIKVFGDDVDVLRKLLAHILGAIPGPESTGALVSFLLAESVPDVREDVMMEMENRREPEAETLLGRALRSRNPAVVNRSAWALARLTAIKSVPGLVSALVSTRYETVMTPSPAGFGEGASLSAAFGSIAPTSTMGGTPIAYNGSSIGYLNGVAVGPGVVAYGASVVPFYPVPNPLSTLPSGVSASMGATTGISAGGGLAASRGPTPRVVAVSVQNVEVLAALVRLTGEDFGYDVPTWKHWLRTSFKPNPVPARHVPQP